MKKPIYLSILKWLDIVRNPLCRRRAASPSKRIEDFLIICLSTI